MIVGVCLSVCLSLAQLFATAHPYARHTDHAVCIICSNRPHLCTVCRQYSLRMC